MRDYTLHESSNDDTRAGAFVSFVNLKSSVDRNLKSFQFSKYMNFCGCLIELTSERWRRISGFFSSNFSIFEVGFVFTVGSSVTVLGGTEVSSFRAVPDVLGVGIFGTLFFAFNFFLLFDLHVIIIGKIVSKAMNICNGNSLFEPIFE